MVNIKSIFITVVTSIIVILSVTTFAFYKKSQFDEKMKLDKEKLALDKVKVKSNNTTNK